MCGKACMNDNSKKCHKTDCNDKMCPAECSAMRDCCTWMEDDGDKAGWDCS